MRASLPTVASAETTRQVNTRPVDDSSLISAAPRLASGTIHSTPRIPKVANGIKMTPTHNYAKGMQGVHVTHEV